ncbi:NAD(P)-binding domain-containing protein [Corynebacterium sp. S7]
MEALQSLVIGAGQAGLSSSYHLQRLGISHVVLDANAGPGGAWQHRWDSLTMNDVHDVADLPGAIAPKSSSARANEVVPAWYGAYEHKHYLPIIRPVDVDAVEDLDGMLLVRAGDRQWVTQTLINATGTWRRPFIPYYPGQETFHGEQIHTADYPGRGHFRGKRVVVVGAGASATQFIGEIATLSDVVWVTRRPPRRANGEFTGRSLIARVQESVLEGRVPRRSSEYSGIHLRAQEMAAAATGIYERRRPMFSSIEADGVRWADGSFEPVDIILWATGFRHDVGHLAPLKLKSEYGGIQLLPGNHDVQTTVTSAVDPRIQFVGYGPSASTIGGNRAGRAAAVAVRDYLKVSADFGSSMVVQ